MFGLFSRVNHSRIQPRFESTAAVSLILAAGSTVIATIYRQKTLKLQKLNFELTRDAAVSDKFPSTYFKQTLENKFKERYLPKQFLSSEYINRGEIEVKIKQYKKDMISQEKIVVLVGQHGSGKSMTLNYCLYEDPAIIHINVDNTPTMNEVGWLILTEGCGINKAIIGQFSPLSVFEDSCYDFKNKYGYYPTLVVDISPATLPESFLAIVRVGKRFVCDSRCCAVFITLSTALLALIPMTEIRLEYLYMPSFTINEIRKYLAMLGGGKCTRFSEDDIRFIKKEMGTTPYELRLIFQSQLQLSLFMVECKTNFISNMMNSLLDKSSYASPRGMLMIYKLLITKNYEEGVISFEVVNISKMPLTDVGIYIRTYQILDYFPGVSGRCCFGGSFFFRNPLAYTAAKILLTDKNYTQFIESVFLMNHNHNHVTGSYGPSSVTE